MLPSYSLPRDDLGDPSTALRPRVFVGARTSRCWECADAVGGDAYMVIAGKKRVLCIGCANLGHLVFFPSSDTAAARRVKERSAESAVVLAWGRVRRHHARMGLLVERSAIAGAEASRVADAVAKERHRRECAARREKEDATLVAAFAARVRRLFPRCPPGREQVIARHTCARNAARIGRSAAARALEEEAVRRAVCAVRHCATEYDSLLERGCDSVKARSHVRRAVGRILEAWGG